MMPLRLETFIEAYRDYELGQYQVLAGLQNARKELSHNRLYPTLSGLVSLYHSLVDITRARNGLKDELPRRVVGLDFRSREILYETISLTQEELDAVAELILWGLPKIQEAIEEGKTIYNFVEEQITLEEVGLLPSYVDEGYLLVPDSRRGRLHVIRYEVSIFSGADQKYRNLKTQTIKSFPLEGIDASPWHIKQELMHELKDLPNPATYTFTSEIDLPYEEALLPIAKRKLLRRLYS